MNQRFRVGDDMMERVAHRLRHYGASSEPILGVDVAVFIADDDGVKNPYLVAINPTLSLDIADPRFSWELRIVEGYKYTWGSINLTSTDHTMDISTMAGTADSIDQCVVDAIKAGTGKNFGFETFHIEAGGLYKW